MSIKLMANAFELDFKDEPLLKFVLVSLCNYANSEDEAWPSYPTIAKFCSISESTAYRHIHELEKRGYIKKTKRIHKNGRCTSNVYSINLTPNENATLSPCQGDPVTVTPSTLSPCYPSKENHHKEPSKESILAIKDDQEKFFNVFWESYPRKVKKDAALKAFKKVNPSLEEVKQDIEWRKKNDPTWKDSQFIPYPASYLNAKRWEESKATAQKARISIYDLKCG